MEPLHEEIIKAIRHYQDRLERYNSNKNEEKMLYALRKLSKLPIKTIHLEATGVGRTVNALKKLNGKVGESAKDLVNTWKNMVLEEEKAPQESSMETEEDADSVYSSDKESPTLHIEEGKENVNSSSSDSESEPEDSKLHKKHTNKNENYLSSKSNKNKDYSNEDSHSKYINSEKNSKKHTKKRDYSSDSSSSDRSSHKSKKHKHGKETLNHSKHKSEDKESRDEKLKKHKSKDRHSSSSKHKNDCDNSDVKHRSKKDLSLSEHKSDKHSKHEDKTEKHKKSSHSSKHKSSHSSKNENKEDKDKEKHQSRKENSSADKKQKDYEKKKVKDSPNSSLKSKQSIDENEDKQIKKEKAKTLSQKKIVNGIDSESGASFAEALGMCGPLSSTSSKKKIITDKKSPKPSHESSKSSSTSKSNRDKSPNSSSSSSKIVPELLKEEPPEPLNICLSSLLPEITPNYKPTPINLDLQSKRFYNDEEALSRVISNKNQRTKVYSGNKTVGKVESLFQLCVRILQDNIDALEYTGGVPYLILKPILERATPDQLFNMEHHNPYLIEDTDELWQLHCQKDFRTKKREELESWREMYMRCLDEREARLNFITANIKQSQDKSEPVRTTKLAYIDSAFVKPPRNIARKQAKNGTVNTDRKLTPTQKLSSLAKSGDVEKIALPNPGNRAVDRSSNSSSAAVKPKKAPLMAKTLSFFKNRFKR